MTKGSSHELTLILRQWADGEPGAEAALLEEVYGTLRGMARSRLSKERAGHTLQPTALVHEAYLKIAQGSSVEWRNRVHFLAVAARVMRQVLVDAGRKRSADKRTPDPPLTTTLHGEEAERVDVLDLERALERLERLNPNQAKVVELRCFGGLTVPEVAEVLDVSVATVNRAWRAARTWLRDELEPGGGR
ncbi:sigma-70 family RNA polymerase sigma factor [Halomonas denitrificans]|nr:sigma-70 family RNA polymerase sigma factor [Halomonas denitrificans]